MRTANVGGVGTTITYDPLMRLYQGVGGGVSSKYAYDGINALAEYNGPDVLQRRWVYDPTTGQPVVWYEGTGTAATDRRYLSADERGSIISVSDSSGASLGINTYDEYGNPGGALAGRYGYTGQAWLANANLWHLNARAYSPKIGGRFLQPDPLGYAGDGPNLYAYVLNDPVNFVDTRGTGLECGSEVYYTYTNPFFPQDSYTDYRQHCSYVPDIGKDYRPDDRSTDRREDGTDPADKSEPTKPKFCSNPTYKSLDEIDKLLAKAQWFALGGAALSRGEQYAVMRAAGTASALEVYGYFGVARLAVNVGKAALGDYRGAVSDVALGIIGKAAGVDALGQVIGGQIGDAITNAVGGSVCQ